MVNSIVCSLNNEVSMKKLNQKMLYRSTPGWFATFSSGGKWDYPKHISYLDKLLVKFSNRKFKRLLVNMPPRHGKSELISKYFPAWYLASNPGHRLILSSYSASFASVWGRKVKDLIDTAGNKMLGINLRKDVNGSREFMIDEHGGGMCSVGARGSITGRGADLFIIDDPVKNEMESGSRRIRDNLWNWFNSTAFTRLEPDGIMIIIMTRWHEDDLTGRIMKNFNVMKNIDIMDNSIIIPDNAWLQVSLPLVSGENDILGRNQGDPLWPQRFGKAAVENIKSTVGNYWFSAMYQQAPVSDTGNLFRSKYFQYFTSDNLFYYLQTFNSGKITRYKSDCHIYATIDLAVTTNESSDYTAAVIFAVTKTNEILILDVRREKIEGAEHLNFLHSIFNRWKPQLIGIESVQYQISLVQVALRAGLPVKSMTAHKNKRARAMGIATFLEGGKIFFAQNAHWLNDFESELLNFPNGQYDDMTDAFSYIAEIISPLSNNLPASRRNGDLPDKGIGRNF